MNRPVDMPVIHRVSFLVNGIPVEVACSPAKSLAYVLREDLRLTGTKIGCDAGDCGACTVLVGGKQICACLKAVGSCEGSEVITVEGLAIQGELSALQTAFLSHGAAQCGICTPAMLMAAQAVLNLNPHPSEEEVLDGLGGVLCRCTGYRKIVEAVMDAAGGKALVPPAAGQAVGARLPRSDGVSKLTGAEIFGADRYPENALWLRVIRSPHPRARFTLGDLAHFQRNHPAVVEIITAVDVPENSFAVFPAPKDQPVLADGHVRFRGEAVLGLLGERDAILRIPESEIPIQWQALAPLLTTEEALAATDDLVHGFASENVLCRGRVVKGEVQQALAQAVHIARGEFRSVYVEHAYIEPEAGYAEMAGDRLRIFACTQTPYMDKEEVARVLGIAPERVHVIPSGIGGGFGGKLDVSVQPLLAVACWKTQRPVRIAYTRPESMLSTTKRHPSRIHATLGCNEQGTLTAVDFAGDFNTGAYASWGSTVANRVPVHASGPYAVENVRALTRAVYTNNSISGAFRGFGVPQACIATEALMDDLAEKCGLDKWEFRYRNSLRAGQVTATGQTLHASVGLAKCLEALRPAWMESNRRCEAFNRISADTEGESRARFDHSAGSRLSARGISHVHPRGDDHGKPFALSESKGERRGDGVEPSACSLRTMTAGRAHAMQLMGRKRRGVGIACMWYGIGNTGIANPSTMTGSLRRDGRLFLYNGAQEIGQGTQTIMPQIFADAVGLPISLVDQVMGDTDLTEDAGKSSASRQAFVSGNAAKLAGEDLRRRLCDLMRVDAGVELRIDGTTLLARGAHGVEACVDLATLPADERDDVAVGRGHFNPPTVPLDAHGQGAPYATYGFAAQLAEVEVDLDYGTVRVLHIHAAHDVGRAINPTLVEGQIHGGVAQGIGMALMEEYINGKTDNLHDYLIPTFGDVPPITTYLIEDHEPLGPYGAKGVGEPALVATAPAILNAIRDATGVRVQEVPCTPARLHALLREKSP